VYFPPMSELEALIEIFSAMTHKIEWVYKNMRIVSTNFAKTLVWKHEYDIKQ